MISIARRCLRRGVRPFSYNAFSLTDLKEDVDKFDAMLPVSQASTPPSTWWTRAEYTALEAQSVWRKQWNMVGVVDNLPSLDTPGSFFTAVLPTGDPCIVVVDDKLQLRSFLNVCQHHATKVEKRDAGCANRFVCPYHGWEYNLDGQLVKAARLAGIENFHASKIRLPELSVTTQGPLVFVHYDGPLQEAKKISPSRLRRQQRLARQQGKEVDEAASQEVVEAAEPTGKLALSKPLRELSPVIEPLISKDSLEFVVHKTYHLNCNWKVFADNYLDGGYHVSVAHPSLSSGLEVDSYSTELYPEGDSIQSCAAQAERGCDRVSGMSHYAFAYPNVMINCYGPWVDINVAVPDPASPHNRCLTHFYYYLDSDKAQDEDYVATCLEASDVVQQEDVELCELVQTGLQSSGYNVGRYAPKVEHAMYHFHQKLHADFAEALRS